MSYFQMRQSHITEQREKQNQNNVE